MTEPLPTDRVAAARSLHSPDDAVTLYRDWAEQYDRDVFDTMGFTGTDRIADLLVEQLATHPLATGATVVDLGCGTGRAGARLAAHGVHAVDGFDISPEMLAVAARGGWYRRLIEADLTDPGFLADHRHAYDASVSAGTFTSGHVGASAVHGIAQLLRPGAVVAWVVAAPLWQSIEVAMEAVRLDVLHADLEPIRRDGPPEARMVVAIRRSPA